MLEGRIVKARSKARAVASAAIPVEMIAWDSFAISQIRNANLPSYTQLLSND